MYNTFYVAVRNKAGKFNVIGQDLGTLEYAIIIAQNNRAAKGRDVQVREYQQESVFGDRKLIQIHEVP